eukprot:GHVN01095814.1.p2 GENE.GHVN01095814.1~~GHVN01095814.1.p2  ORF type:complete len:125 (+),score=15.29 GHVN01095814.1:134-508(+)
MTEASAAAAGATGTTVGSASTKKKKMANNSKPRYSKERMNELASCVTQPFREITPFRQITAPPPKDDEEFKMLTSKELDAETMVDAGDERPTITKDQLFGNLTNRKTPGFKHIKNSPALQSIIQ